MAEKVSHLLTKAKEALVENNPKGALVFCKDVMKKDGNNINAMLMTTKCLMDLNESPEEILKVFNKVLELKPKHAIAIQGLRKFYQKYLSLFKDDGIRFYHELYLSNELTSLDIEVITLEMTKMNLSPEDDQFVYSVLLSEIRTKANEDCLKIFCEISLEKYIVNQNIILINELFDILILFGDNQDSGNVDYVRNMCTFVRSILEEKNPEEVYNIMTDLSLKNVYTSVLFSRLLCDNYMMLDCEESVAIAMDQLQKWDSSKRAIMSIILTNIHFENLIHLGDLDSMKRFLTDCDVNILSPYLRCQASALGVEGLPPFDEGIILNNNDPLRSSLYKVMTQYKDHVSVDEVNNIKKLISDTSLSSFELFLWANLLEKLGRLDDRDHALGYALKTDKVFFRVYLELAAISSSNKNYKMAVQYLEMGLQKCFLLEIVEALVDLHIEWNNYVEPLKLLELLDIDNCSQNLLLKFVCCLTKLEKTTDAISLVQRVVKRCPDQSDYWQLLGDLYLKRGNINHAYKTYQKSAQLRGEESSDNLVRMGNVFSLSYCDTMEPNEFMKSLTFFDKSLELATSFEALEGKASLLFVHAEVSLKQLMLSSAIKDINTILKDLVNHHDVLKESRFLMNMLGKVLLLSVMGSIDNFVDLVAVKHCYFCNLPDADAASLSRKCFEISIDQYPTLADSHFHFGILELYLLNKNCVNVRRGQVSDSSLYFKIDSHFKKVLTIEETHGDAWKYLGYLYLKHGIHTEKLSLDIQHCLSMAINVTSDMNRINDPEAAYYLGLLYIRENWFDLAREVFEKIKMDYPVNSIGFIGMYLLSDKDHTVEEQPEVARALMCYVYRDDTMSVRDSHHQLNSSLVGLFAENMSFLVHCNEEKVQFDGRVEPSSLVNALKTALENVWSRYLAYSSLGFTFTETDRKQLREYGCFLGIMELLLGDFHYGKKLILKSSAKDENDTSIKLHNLLELHDLWEEEGFLSRKEKSEALSRLVGLDPETPSSVTSSNAFSVRQFQKMLISAVVDQFSPGFTSYTYVQPLVSSIHLLAPQTNLSREGQISIILALASLILTLNDTQLALSFLDVVQECYLDFVNEDDRLTRVVARLKLCSNSDWTVPDVFRYLHDHCLKQPFLMDRWFNLLEFGLEFLDGLRDHISVNSLFSLTHRPWCMTPLDYRRYSSILVKLCHLVPVATFQTHRRMMLTAMMLFPDQCFSVFRNLQRLN